MTDPSNPPPTAESNGPVKNAETKDARKRMTATAMMSFRFIGYSPYEADVMSAKWTIPDPAPDEVEKAVA
jgi:hypothetical protein